MKHWIRSMSYPAKWLVFITVSEVVFSETISRKTLFLFKPIMEINGYSTFFYQLWILYPIKPDGSHVFWVIFPFYQFVQSVGHPRSTPRHHTLLTSLRISQVRPRKMCLLFGYLVLNVENGGNDPSFLWLVVWNMAFMTFHILGMSSSRLTDSYFSER